MIKILSLLFITTLLSTNLKAQKTSDSTRQIVRKNAVFIELLGATGYFSLNYERVIPLYKQLYIHAGIGVNFNVTFKNNVPSNIFVLRTDLQYGNKRRINPVIGYAFSYGIHINDVNDPLPNSNPQFNSKNNSYLVNTPSIGININISNRIALLPKFYMMFFYEPKYSNKYIIYWSGLQIKYKF